MHTCPHCTHPLPDTVCSSCGVWWLSGHVELVEVPPSPPTTYVVLRESTGCAWYAVFGGFAALGATAAWTSLDRLLAHPHQLLPWLTALVGVPLGGLVAAMTGLGMFQWALQSVVPTRIDATPTGLRLRCWRGWEGPPASLRRTDVTFRPGDLDAVGFWTTQGRQSLIALRHRSGAWVGTPWSGPRSRAEAHAASLHALLRGARGSLPR